MIYLFLDESGDASLTLKKGTSTYLIICALKVDKDNLVLIEKVVKDFKRNLRLNFGIHGEMKDINKSSLNTEENLSIKKDLLNQLNPIDFRLYCVVVRKSDVKSQSPLPSREFYDYAVEWVVHNLEINPKLGPVRMIFDKSKALKQISSFNYRIRDEINIIHPYMFHNTEVLHYSSQDSNVLQLVDIFCNGIFLAYERNDKAWYNCFKHRLNEVRGFCFFWGIMNLNL